VRPYPEEVLKAIQTGVMSHFLPELQSSYAKAQLTFAMLLFTIAQRDYDTAVPDLVADSDALRRLLVETEAALAQIGGDAAAIARASIRSAPQASGSLKLSELRRENEALRAVIAGMAPLIEPAADHASLAPLRDVRAKVFDYLKADARKRIVPILTV
jgi:hypothetical protein